MIFHENCLLADNSHETSYLIFFKIWKMLQNLPSAAVVIGALRVKSEPSFSPYFVCVCVCVCVCCDKETGLPGINQY